MQKLPFPGHHVNIQKLQVQSLTTFKWGLGAYLDRVLCLGIQSSDCEENVTFMLFSKRSLEP